MIPHEEGASGAGSRTEDEIMSASLEQGALGASLDLRDLHAANIARQAEWCSDQVPDLSFRGNELGGECGEAQNVIKKLERERQGWRGSRATKEDLADELADVVICADLCAVTADIDLGAAVRRKFNATSEKQGLSVFLPSPAPATPPGVPDSVRALSEAVIAVSAMSTVERLENAAVGGLFHCEADREEAVEIIAEAIRAATHPAGQSAGSGAGWRERAATEIDAIAHQWGTEGDDDGRAYAKTLAAIIRAEAPAPDSTSTGLPEAEQRTVRGKSCQGMDPAEPYDPLKVAVWAALLPFRNELLETGGVTFMGLRNAIVEAVRSFAIASQKPAPDSTRTGDEGTEWVLVPTRMDVGMIAAFWRWKNTGSDTPGEFGDDRSDAAAYRAMIAARPAATEAQGAWVSQAAQDVLAERRRQVEAEGWTPEHDDRHEYTALATAAACYIRQGRYCYPEPGKPGPDWPWAPEWWKPSSYRRNLVKAGALILAEIERLDRLPAPPASSGQGGR